MLRLRLFLLFVASMMAAAAPAMAQFANADLAGTVTTEDGASLPGVTVTALNEETGLTRTAITSGNGLYAINGLKPGRYTLTFELAGLKTVEHKGVELRVGQKTRLGATLGMGAVAESITITAAAPVIEVDTKEVGGTLTAQEFKDLPTQNRSFVLFSALLPGVVPAPDTESTSSDSLFINGQDDNNNSFNVDGANNDDDVIGARAGAQTRTAIEAIQEFQILTTQYDAEFGRTVGGVLNAITKSGTNELKGTAFAFFQDAEWNEKDFFAERANLPKPDAQFRSLGFTLGGPILRDRAHYFASYEDNLDKEGIARFFTVRPEASFSTSENNEIRNYLVKLDYQLTDNHHAALRYLVEESPQFNQIIGTQITLEGAREEDDTDLNWIGTLDSVFGNRAFNTARVSFTEEDVAFANPGFNANGQNFEAQRNLPPVLDRPSINEGASDVAQARVNQSLQVDDTISLFLPEFHGEHELRAGFQWSNREETFSNFGTANGEFDFNTDRPFDPNDITTYPTFFTIRVKGGASAEIPANETLGIFVQDDWRISGNLTLNLGLRWDREEIVDDDNFGPRLGFAWDPFGDHRTVVRGGYGRFYDRLELGSWSSFFLDSINVTQGFLLRVPDAGTNQQLFFDLARQNNVTTLAQLRDLLARQLEEGAGTTLNSSPTVDHRDRTQPYVDTISLGAEHEVFRGWAVGVDLVHSENKDTLLVVDLNPFSRGRNSRPNISILNGEVVRMGSITTFVNAGESEYNAIQLSVRKNFTERFGGRISYTYADSEGNYGNAGGGLNSAYYQTRTETGYNFDTGEIIGEPLQLNLNDPRSKGQPVNWHRDHNLVVSGSYLVPATSWRGNAGLTLSWIYRYMSGDRFTILTNTLLDNGSRAPAAPGTYDATTPSDIAQNDVKFTGTSFGAEAPDFRRLDLSLRYSIPLGFRDSQLTLLGDVFNATDELNFASAGGSIVGTGGFLTPTAAFNPREFQLGARLSF